MKKLVFILLLLPMLGSAQNKPRTDLVNWDLRHWHDTTVLRCIYCPPPPPVNVKIYVDDEDPVQTLIDALKKVGVIVERTEWNYEKKYSNYLIIKTNLR